MNKPLQNKIYLTVTNPGKLQPGANSRMEFDTAGGTIGSNGANWILEDFHGQINPVHSEIKWLDGMFCVVDRCGDTRINNSNEGLGPSHVAQLNEHDIIHIGPYTISVYFSDIQNKLPDSSKSLGQHSISELVNENARQLTDHAAPGEAHLPTDKPINPGKAEFEKMSTNNRSDKTAFDPLAALDAEMPRHDYRAGNIPLDPTHFGKSPVDKTQPNYTETSGEAVSFSGSSLPEEAGYGHAPYQSHQEWQTAYAQAGDGAQHLASLPFQQGMQVNLGSMDSNALYELLLEAGKSLRATINGISKLYDDETGNAYRLSMLTRTLQPIEDNPLRLKQGYEDTVRNLFSEYRSAVHLSAPAAIEESLEQARIHNIAIIQAIGESLNALLAAFSPSVLRQRFERYNETEQQSGDDGWAWRMYNHYYNELTSSRQQGFEKLFWEVFEQAYDRAMRERSS